ncbi:MAG: hypothetical protein PSV22_22735 [Pseudolabrys sp.]|nr:hypothetical protein [Pseudolabrys sp.]
MIAVLPGEDQSAYDKLHRDLVDELKPAGALEKDQVETIARLTWRKRNFATLHIAMLAKRRMADASRQYTQSSFELALLDSPLIPFETIAAAQEDVRKEFAGICDFEAAGVEVSLETLARDLDLAERIDGLIDKCMKRLLFLRGLKSMSSVGPE